MRKSFIEGILLTLTLAGLFFIAGFAQALTGDYDHGTRNQVYSEDQLTNND